MMDAATSVRPVSDPAATSGTGSSVPTEDQMSELVKKHRGEIDYVLAMTSANQQQEIAKYGLDPAKLADYYKPLLERSDRLENEDEATNRKMVVLGAVSAGAAATAAFVFRKSFSKANALLQGTFVVLSSMAAGLAGSLAGARIFGVRVRHESKQLAADARGALEREVAIALENREIDAAAKGLPAPVAPTIDNCEQTARHCAAPAAETTGSSPSSASFSSPKITPRVASFASQHAADQAAAHSSVAQIG